MKKRLFPYSILISFLAFAGLGCKGISEEQQAAIAPVTLNYWTVYNDMPELRKLAEEYKKVRPYVTVNIRQVRVDEFDRIFTNALADDVGPDVVSLHTRWLPKYASRLSPMPPSVKVATITTEGTYKKETVVTVVQQAMPSARDIANNYVGTVSKDVTIGGIVYGLPLALDTLAIYYNRDLLDQSGVATPPSTWEDFTKAVQKTTKFDRRGEILQSGVALGTGKNIDNAADIFALFVLQNGLDMTRAGAAAFAGGLSQSTAESHPAVRSLRFYGDFAKPTTNFYSWNDKQGNALEAFARGKSVFYLGFAYDWPRIRTLAPQMNVNVIPVPQLDPGSPVNVANYWAESVVKKSRHQDEAWDFVRFIASPANVKRYTAATRRPSPLRSQVVEQKENPDLAPFAVGILNAKNWYSGRDEAAATLALKDMMQKYLAPYGETEDPNTRDANLVIQAASVVQQTL